jgi:hypothetical protein
MQKPEFRVRPVIRHVVTRYTPSHSPEPGVINGPSLETLGEFDSEGYAEIVKEALDEMAAPREYVIVESTLGEKMASVTYAYSEEEALKRMAEEAADGKAYKVYSRIKEQLG